VEIRQCMRKRIPKLGGDFALTPKTARVEQLRAAGKSFDEAFAIADREYTSDGMSLKPDASNAILASGVSQMGEVQI
jgi:hypothetical protein